MNIRSLGFRDIREWVILYMDVDIMEFRVYKVHKLSTVVWLCMFETILVLDVHILGLFIIIKRVSKFYNQ